MFASKLTVVFAVVVSVAVVSAAVVSAAVVSAANVCVKVDSCLCCTWHNWCLLLHKLMPLFLL